MYRVELPLQSEPDQGLDAEIFRSQQGCYLPGYAYEISTTQADTLRAAMKEMAARYNDAMDYVTSTPRVLRSFFLTNKDKINKSLLALASESWVKERNDGYVIDRWDIAWDGITAPKLLERNFGYLGLIAGTAGVQENVIKGLQKQQGFEEITSFGGLRQNFIEAFTEVTRRKGIIAGSKILITTPQLEDCTDQGMIVAADMLCEWVQAAGFQVCKSEILGFRENGTEIIEILPTKELNSLNNCYDGNMIVKAERILAPDCKNGMYPEAIFPFYGYSLYAESRIETCSGKVTVQPKAQMLMPAWTLLMQNKSMLPILYELFPDHPNFLPAFAGPGGLRGQKSVIKHIRVGQGFCGQVLSRFGKRLELSNFEDGVAEAENYPEDFISQAYCPQVENPDGSRKVLHVFTTDGTPAAIGMRESRGFYVGGSNTDTSFLPIVVRSSHSVQKSSYGRKVAKKTNSALDQLFKDFEPSALELIQKGGENNFLTLNRNLSWLINARDWAKQKAEFVGEVLYCWSHPAAKPAPRRPLQPTLNDKRTDITQAVISLLHHRI